MTEQQQGNGMDARDKASPRQGVARPWRILEGSITPRTLIRGWILLAASSIGLVSLAGSPGTVGSAAISPDTLEQTGPTGSLATSSDPDPDEGIHHFRSRHFIVHTDLDETAYRQRLAAMEKVIQLASRYWGERLSSPIECYLVEDMDRWKAADLPSPLVLRVLRHLGGGTDLKTVQRSRSQSGRTPARPVVYATTKLGVVEHEVVHAYCFQTFGHGGPDWYREGMAELFAQWVVGRSPESTQHESLARLRTVPDIRTRAIVTQSLRAEQLRASLARESQATTPAAWHWTAADERTLEQAQLAYAQSWALCSLLTQHERYRERFRTLGRHWLQGGLATFDESFGGAEAEIDFELSRFVSHYEDGYRVDLVAWPWSAEPRPLSMGEEVTIRVAACRGFQATRVAVAKGEQYRISVEGTWHLDPQRASVHGAGVSDEASLAADAKSREGLLGLALMRDYRLVHESPLEQAGSQDSGVPWSPDEAGHLLVRCLEPWHKLSDNRGVVSVRILRLR